MKLCGGMCKKLLPKSAFTRNADRPDGLNSICRACKKVYNQRYYERTKAKHAVARRDASLENRRRRIADIAAYLQQQVCVDCGNADWRVLEFDHLRDKTKNVSLLVNSGYSWKRILEEIEKCEVVCANCHRIRTYRRSGGRGFVFAGEDGCPSDSYEVVN